MELSKNNKKMAFAIYMSPDLFMLYLSNFGPCDVL